MEERNRNVKLFPIYKMISWDLLFFYSIIFLYLVQVKNLSAPQVLLAEALYNVAVILFLEALTSATSILLNVNSKSLIWPSMIACLFLAAS